MAQYNKFLCSITNNTQRVIGFNTRQELVNREIIQLRPNDRGFDMLILPENTYIPTIFPNNLSHHIPYRLSSKAFIEYLGIKPILATEIFATIFRDNHGIVDGEIIYKHIKIYVGESLNRNGNISQNVFEEGVLPNQVPFNNIMDWLGFQEDFIADFNQLKLSASQTPAAMDYYLAEETLTKAFRDLDLIDYIFATLLRRVANLRSLNRAMKIYLNQNPK